MPEKDWKKDTSIDPMRLDVEWLQQSHLVAVYSQDLAAVRGELDEYAVQMVQLEEDRKGLRGKIQLDVRTNPKKYGLEKVTDTIADATLRIQEDWVGLNDKIIALMRLQAAKKLQESSLFGILKALDHKRDAMEKLVTLLGQDYFSGPRVPHDLTKCRNDISRYMDQQDDAKIADSLNKKKKKKRRT